MMTSLTSRFQSTIHWKTVLLIFFYTVNLCLFFTVLWKEGETVYSKCIGNWRCRQYLHNSPVILSEYFGIQYQLDLADTQWKDFRQSLSLLSKVAVGTVTLSWFVRWLWNNDFARRFRMNTWLRLVIGVTAIVVQHSWHSLIVFAICGMGFVIAQLALSVARYPWLSKAIIWMFAISVLLFKESYRIQTFSHYFFFRILFDRRYGGMYGWQFPANFLVLRLISFSIDFLEAYSSGHHKKSDDDSNAAAGVLHRDGHHSHEITEYSFVDYMAYMCYAPLYIAGPIVSFNSFISFSKRSQQQENLWWYGLRWVFCFLLLEAMTARFPLTAVVASGLLPHLNVKEIAVVFYLVLKMMWLKFLIIWRFFRWWAMADGIMTVENQQRCMSNNYSLEQFWKGWHASFNQWIVRYMYKPMGGRQYRFFNVWLIFLFVALWHDFEWKLLVWGLLNATFYVIEGIIKHWRLRVLGQEQHELSWTPMINRLLVTIIGAMYIVVLVSVNLVGYCTGTGALPLLQHKVMTMDGLRTLLGTLYFLAVGVNIMLHLQWYGWTKKET
jgi:protein-cysteine N-palmitoyltransferase HHAT